jgi:HSP20 family protein
MTNVLPRQTFSRDLFDFRRDFEQIFNRILLGGPLGKEEFTTHTGFGFMPAVESYVDKREKKYVCRLSLPGSDLKNIEIHTQGNYLTIQGERKSTRTTREIDMLNEEIVYGSFERTLTLPQGIVTDKLEAEYKDGILEITAPITAAALPHKVEIKSLPSAKKAAA